MRLPHLPIQLPPLVTIRLLLRHPLHKRPHYQRQRVLLFGHPRSLEQVIPNHYLVNFPTIRIVTSFDMLPHLLYYFAPLLLDQIYVLLLVLPVLPSLQLLLDLLHRIRRQVSELLLDLLPDVLVVLVDLCHLVHLFLLFL